MIKTIKISTFCTLILLLTFTSNSFAYNDYSGLPVYRDGVFIGPIEVNWHAGLMYHENVKEYGYNAIIHINGPGYDVEFCSYDDFLDGNDFMGVYAADDCTSNDRDDIRETASDLTMQAISYTFLNLLEYDDDPGTYINPSEIDKLRCDGVVEYCYEWNNVMIRDGDISKTSLVDDHSPLIGPRGQAMDYLEFIDSAAY
ncbi:hypothetical protein [Wukongibacter sp. M2B1]|uniref:hypothetical protein n=1 Tax=Wukongibacter sp. M2B1 TaxID=3088895 RepID=UPI003D7A83C2